MFLNDNVYLLGRRDDIPMIMNEIDLFTLSSISEAFPNVLNEAMASFKTFGNASEIDESVNKSISFIIIGISSLRPNK